MTDSSITIIQREPSAFISTSFNEIVTCRLGDGTVRRLLLKRGVSHAEVSNGHHGGVPYEVEVYRSVLRPLNTSTPRLHDAYTDGATQETVLIIDYLENSQRLSKADRSYLYGAAAWIGWFHRMNEDRVDSLPPVITRYDDAYYLSFMQRTLDTWVREHIWLKDLHRYWKELVHELRSVPQTVIHGEYYPKNILVHDKRIAPIDWETAAVATGEIDLACLTERWSDADRSACQREYVRARWPENPPAGLARILAIADIYVQLRWLGQPGIGERQAPVRLPRLQVLCREVGIPGS